MNNSVGAVIVTYNSTSAFTEVLNSALTQVDWVYIADNNSNQECIKMLLEITQLHKSHCELQLLQKNVGLGKAYNIGVEFLKKQGCKCFLFMDDDSILDAEYVDQMLKAAKRQPKAILGGNYEYAVSGVQKKYEVFSRFLFAKSNTFQNGLLKAGFAISSGSLISEKTYDLVGRFTEEFFIDYIDIEYCLRADRKGVSTFIVQNARFRHHQGEPIKRKLFGVSIETRNYSPLRNYYRMRNRVSCWKKYGMKRWGFMVWDLLSFELEVFKIVAVEDGKRKKIKSTIRGIFHGFTGQFI